MIEAEQDAFGTSCSFTNRRGHHTGGSKGGRCVGGGRDPFPPASPPIRSKPLDADVIVDAADQGRVLVRHGGRSHKPSSAELGSAAVLGTAFPTRLRGNRLPPLRRPFGIPRSLFPPITGSQQGPDGRLQDRLRPSIGSNGPKLLVRVATMSNAPKLFWARRRAGPCRKRSCATG